MSTKALADLQASSIDSILQEHRNFEPPAEFSRHAHIKSLEEYEDLYKESIDDPDKFWAASPANCTGSRSGTKSSSGISLGQVVRRRPDQSLLQLPRPPRR